MVGDEFSTVLKPCLLPEFVETPAVAKLTERAPSCTMSSAVPLSFFSSLRAKFRGSGHPPHGLSALFHKYGDACCPGMTNDEIPKPEGMTKSEWRKMIQGTPLDLREDLPKVNDDRSVWVSHEQWCRNSAHIVIRHSGFGLYSGLGISSFVIFPGERLH